MICSTCLRNESYSVSSAYEDKILHFTKHQNTVNVKLLLSQNTLPLLFFSPSSFPRLSSAFKVEIPWSGSIIYPVKLQKVYCSAFHCLLIHQRRQSVYQIAKNQIILFFIDQYQTFKIHAKISRQLVQSTTLSFYVFPLRNQFSKEAIDFYISFGV